MTVFMNFNEAVATIKDSQADVLCLDTCDFRDVLRGVAEGSLNHARSFRSMFEAMVTSGRFQIVVTYLVRHEWDQDPRKDREKVEKFLGDIQSHIDRIDGARVICGHPRSSYDSSLFETSLASELIGMAENVMNRAIHLAKDNLCIERALGRVMDRRRPSHKNEIKDSIHWEHYLELSRQLEAVGHEQNRIFVSANKSDFWASNDNPSLHEDLRPEAEVAGLRFHGKLDDSLRVLGV